MCHSLAGTLEHLADKGFNPLNAELNPICHLLALLGAHHILHISRIRVNDVLIHTETKRLISGNKFKKLRKCTVV